MSDFDGKVIERLKRLEREVERLQVKERPVVIADHGNLTGLGDNDHPQYVRGVDLGVWTAYTPAWTAATTNPSIGDGSIIGRYTQIGKTVVCNITLTIGSTTNCGSGNWKIGLPKTSKNSNVAYNGIWVALDSGANFYDGVTVLYPDINFINTFIRTGNFSGLSASSPHSWGQGDQLYLAITYEAA